MTFWKAVSVIGLITLGALGSAAYWLAGRPLTYAATAPSSENGLGAEVRRAEPEKAAELPPLPPQPESPEDAGVEVPDAALPAVATASPGPRIKNFETFENYLLVGVDHTRGRLWGRADTLMVAVFDDSSRHVGVVSIPRDLYVDVPGHGPARINATLRIGTRLGVDPLALLRRVVSDTLSIPIKHTVVGDLEAFEHTVDALGGIEVPVRCPIEDNFIDERTETGRRPLSVAAGVQAFDGITAAMYIRSRHGRSDWDRARRQQAVLLAIRDRIKAMGALEWVPVLSGALESGVTTTLSRWEMIQLGRRVSRLSSRRIHGMLIGSRQVTLHRTSEGRAVLQPNFKEIDAALGKLFQSPRPGVPPRARPCQPADAALR